MPPDQPSSSSAPSSESILKKMVEMGSGEGEKEMKMMMKEKLHKYHLQLLHGCGRKNCANDQCASSGKLPKMNCNEAAARAIMCLTSKAKLCSDSEKEAEGLKEAMEQEEKGNDEGATLETEMAEKMGECAMIDDWTPLRKWIGQTFTEVDTLLRAFSVTSIDDQHEANLDAVRRCFDTLFHHGNDHCDAQRAMINAVVSLCTALHTELRYQNLYALRPQVVVVFLVVMELPILHEMDFFRDALPAFCNAYAALPDRAQKHLTAVWSRQSPDWMLQHVQAVQQAITLRILEHVEKHGERWTLRRLQDDDNVIATAVGLLRVLHEATLQGGIKNQPFVVQFPPPEDVEDVGSSHSMEDMLLMNVAVDNAATSSSVSAQSNLCPWDVGKPLIPFDEFRNDTLSDYLNVEDDFMTYTSHKMHAMDTSEQFTVLPDHAFLVSTTVKQQFLTFENRIRMHGERRQAMLNSLGSGVLIDPYLRLQVSRHDLVKEALDVLGTVMAQDPTAFKKRLRVEFEGEQGVDEGGVSKEFYQLIIDELFNPDYGMFIYNNVTRLYWFNSACTYCRSQYRLIGILFGLAVYNNVLVDVHLPLVLYRKLFGRPAVFADLEQLEPTLYKGLQALLLHAENDVEEVFSYTFCISYQDVFGNNITHMLKPDGDKIPVTNENRHEFVDLYVHFLLNESVQEQFRHFRNGFLMVVDQKMLARICLPEEVEQLVCGVSDLDFGVLERSTRYENGFTDTSPTIVFFWEVVHALSEEHKKLLLQFTTGCDRVPIGGLAKLEFIVARNGDDCTRLPSAHTCFNVLLLPEYKTKENMRERLLKAIMNSRGFGLQ